MQNNQPSINLAKNKDISSFDNAIDWALAMGRLIVIITEIIAVAAFIYRFSLDGRLVNLHSEIKKKQDIVSSQQNAESKYRNLQSRLAMAAKLSASAFKTNQDITGFASLVPNQAIINNLIYKKSEVNIAVDVSSVSILADFIKSLKDSSIIKSININNIENKPSAGLSANITAVIK
jgi:hypothetical protein